MIDVVVIGAGLAGLSAAWHLAARGRRVIVLERDRVPGGRARAVSAMGPGKDETLDMGQHLLMGAYRELFGLVDRLGTRSLLQPLRGPLYFLDGSSRTSFHRMAPLPAPLHLLPSLWGLSHLPWKQRLWHLPALAVEAAWESRTGSDRLDRWTADRWFRSRGVDARTIEGFLGPIVSATVNLGPGEATAALVATVLDRALLASARDATPWLSSVPLHEVLIRPLIAGIEDRGGTVRCGEGVSSWSFDSEEGPVRIRTARGTDLTARQVVLAVGPWDAPALLRQEPRTAALAGEAEALGRSPIATVEVWVDRPVLPARMVGLVGSRWHFAFQHPVRSGSGAACRVSLVASHADDLLGRPQQEVSAEAWKELGIRVPTARDAKRIETRTITVSRATFRARPGQAARRPGPRTALPVLVLAGDWTSTGLPATLEGALRSGRAAAETLGEPSVSAG